MTGGMGMSWVWAVGLITFAFGIAFGVGIAYVFLGNSKRTKELREQLDSLQQQHDDYRKQVGKHFLRTSELVQQMTDSYREVYEHLASGSQSLCQDPISTPRLDFGAPAPGTTKAPEAAQTATDEYSDAEIDNLSDAGSDDYLGDSPHVPKLDDDNAAPGATPPSPSR